MNTSISLSPPLFSFNGALFAHVDAVKELSDILVLHQARHVDESRRLGHVVNIVALHDDAILHRLVTVRLHTIEHIAHTGALLAKEVTNFNNGAVLFNRNVHREVSIHGAHLVAETLSDTVEQVVDVAARGAEGAGALVAREPHGGDNFVGFHIEDEVELRDVVEVTVKNAARTRDGDLARLAGSHLDSFRDFEADFSLDKSHLESV